MADKNRAQTRKLMEELVKPQPNLSAVKTLARGLGLRATGNLEAIMVETLEKIDDLRPKSKKKPLEANS